MADDLLTYLCKKVQEEQEVIEQDLVMGKAKDYGAYQHACGVYRGFLVVKNMLLEVKERMDNHNE